MQSMFTMQLSLSVKFFAEARISAAFRIEDGPVCRRTINAALIQFHPGIGHDQMGNIRVGSEESP